MLVIKALRNAWYLRTADGGLCGFCEGAGAIAAVMLRGVKRVAQFPCCFRRRHSALVGGFVRRESSHQTSVRQCDTMNSATTTEILEQWLYGRPKRTQDEYLRDVSGALTFLNNPPLETITLADLQRYQSHLLTVRHLKDSTVRRKIAALRSLLKFATEQGHLDRNPAIALRSPKDTSSLHERILTREQVASIIAAAPPGRKHAMLRFTYATGARLSEVCGLLWKDCLPQTDRVVVRLLGKGSKWRSVSISEAVGAEVLELRGDAPDDAKVFRMNKQTAHDTFKAAARKAGLPNASMHWFRHSLASHLVAAGMPLPDIRDLLGHSNVAVTNAYTHASPEQNASDYLSL